MTGQKLRERLESLEALAGSAAQRTSNEVPIAGAGGSSTQTNNIPNEPSDGSTSSSSAAAITPGPLQDLIPQPDGALSGLSIWDPTHDPQSSDLSALDVWDSTAYIDPSWLLCDEHKDDAYQSWSLDVQCGCPRPHFQKQKWSWRDMNDVKFKIVRLGPGTAAADPYANHLRIETMCTVDALYTLGLHLGITEELLCADESISPFFRFSADSIDDTIKTAMIGNVKGIFKTLKPDLRPSSQQITVKHHPYIDILPFPTLRDNLISHQDEFDEDEFCHDTLSGLVCWGGAGVGRRDQQESIGYASTGTPWDVRSWEAKGWFLKKYWDFIGGEESELARQSEWWRSIRGDDIDLHIQG